jgi:hypothetical protein
MSALTILSFDPNYVSLEPHDNKLSAIGFLKDAWETEPAIIIVVNIVAAHPLL